MKRCAAGRVLAVTLAGGLFACRAGYVETGDLPALRERGRLRILVPRVDDPMLPRGGYPVDLERELAEQFAESEGIEPQLVEVGSRDGLFDRLLDGRGDLAVARLTVTPERERRMAFSVPVDFTREVLVVPASATPPRTLADLAGRVVTVRRSSAFRGTLERIREDVPGLRIADAPEQWDTERILERVGAGEIEATVADQDLVEATLRFRDDIQIAFPLGGPRPRAWAMRRDAGALKAAVDRFLHEQALIGDRSGIAFGDLSRIRERHVLRVLTRNNGVTTFLHRGEQVGFEFELVRRFARSLGCRVELVIPPGFGDLVPWLMEGRGDLIAASLAVTPARAARVAFTRSYLRVPQMLVVPTDSPVRGVADLAGVRVAVRPSSIYRRTLVSLREAGVDVGIEDVPESRETEELVDGVGDGEFEATVAAGHILDLALGSRDDVHGAFAIGEPLAVAWAVRRQDQALRAAADGFLAREGPGSTFFNVLHERYFESARAPRLMSERPRASGRLSPYDELFRKWGERYGLDWRLLAAQAYQESRFETGARSWAGAHGLMQVLPTTARSLGVAGDLDDPDTAIRAGAAYLRELADEHYPELELSERLRFALAAYNAGPGHVSDARHLARERGLDDGVWFGAVEKVMPLLSRQAYASRARSGYCRCQQAVAYVRDIDQRYARYAAVVE